VYYSMSVNTTTLLLPSFTFEMYFDM